MQPLIRVGVSRFLLRRAHTLDAPRKLLGLPNINWFFFARLILEDAPSIDARYRIFAPKEGGELVGKEVRLSVFPN